MIIDEELATIAATNNINQSYCFEIQVVETRYVTVKAKNLEQAVKKAITTAKYRHPKEKLLWDFFTLRSIGWNSIPVTNFSSLKILLEKGIDYNHPS